MYVSALKYKLGKNLRNHGPCVPAIGFRPTILMGLLPLLDLWALLPTNSYQTASVDGNASMVDD